MGEMLRENHQGVERMKRTLYWRNPEKNYSFEKMGTYNDAYGIVVILIGNPGDKKVYTINQPEDD